MYYLFFFNDTATTEIYTLSLHDALPILHRPEARGGNEVARFVAGATPTGCDLHHIPSSCCRLPNFDFAGLALCKFRSEEHTSELQSRQYLVCRLLLEKKNNHTPKYILCI